MPPPFDITLVPEVLTALVARDAAAPEKALKVVCAWPLSGQYGPGSRFLYYCLVAACVLFQRWTWIRNVSLAGALLLPGIAAVHAIVLASVHRENAVDMDVYGTLQLCAIGILAAPVTVRLSPTYFNDPGRNTIFAWTTLMLAGLMSLAIEFFRLKSTACPKDDNGNPVPTNPGSFKYNNITSCGLVCSVEEGPFSPIRGGATNNIYVIPTPWLSFGAATLITAGCCIPAVLSMASMWSRIRWINWFRNYVGKDEEAETMDEVISGTNNATRRGMKRVDGGITFKQQVVESLVFGGVVLALIIVGEVNLFGKQAMFQTESLASIGQWSPLVGALFGFLGSLYLVLAGMGKEGEKDVETNSSLKHCTCAHDHLEHIHPQATSSAPDVGGTSDTPENDENGPEASHHEEESHEMQDIGLGVFANHAQPQRGSASEIGPLPHRISVASADLELMRTESQYANTLLIPNSSNNRQKAGGDSGYRRKVADAIAVIGDFLGTPAPDYDDSADFKQGEAARYPTVPAEELRVERLRRLIELYDNNIAAAAAGPSSSSASGPGGLGVPADPVQSSSRASSVASRRRRGTSPAPPPPSPGGAGPASPHSTGSAQRNRSRSPFAAVFRHTNTFPASPHRASLDQVREGEPSSPSSLPPASPPTLTSPTGAGGRDRGRPMQRPRRDTLDVPGSPFFSAASSSATAPGGRDHSPAGGGAFAAEGPRSSADLTVTPPPQGLEVSPGTTTVAFASDKPSLPPIVVSDQDSPAPAPNGA